MGKFYYFMGITEDPILANDIYALDFETYAFARCMDKSVKRLVFEKPESGVELCINLCGETIHNPQLADLDECAAIVIPAQKTLMSEGYLGSQDKDTLARIKYLRLAKDLGIPIFYLFQAEDGELYNILHELPDIKPRLICRNAYARMGNLEQVTTGAPLIYDWTPYIGRFLPYHYRNLGRETDAIMDIGVFRDRTEAVRDFCDTERINVTAEVFTRYEFLMFSALTARILYFYNTGGLYEDLISEILTSLGVDSRPFLLNAREMANIRYSDLKITSHKVRMGLEIDYKKDPLCLV